LDRAPARRRRACGDALSAKQELILDSVLTVLARHGLAGVSMRAVAREAGVALGLATYYFTDKTSLVAAALERLGCQDAQLLAADPAPDPVTQLRRALHRVADEQFLATDYLALRLQLWALAPVDPTYARINHQALVSYRDRLADLIRGARPELTRAAAARRAGDIVVIQNGIWLTSLLITDREATDRAVRRCEQIALDPDD
jgi:TetR/AcrR family transcriptional regulator, cholesterol catabolism regulator